jgi:hypothetical protein
MPIDILGQKMDGAQEVNLTLRTFDMPERRMGVDDRFGVGGRECEEGKKESNQVAKMHRIFPIALPRADTMLALIGARQE